MEFVPLSNEIAQHRVERLTTALGSAAGSVGSAQFSMLLSMIDANHHAFSGASSTFTSAQNSEKGSGFALPVSETSYPDPNELNSPVVVERLNRAYRAGDQGDVAYFNSYIDVESRRPRLQRVSGDGFERLALESVGRLVIDEVNASRQQIQVSV